jgi:hypothetical protein
VLLYLYIHQTVQDGQLTNVRSANLIDSCRELTSRALFENYDEDLKQLIASLKGKLEGDVKQLKGGQYS